MDTMTRQDTQRCYCSDLQGVLCGVCREQNRVAEAGEWHTARGGHIRIRLYWRPTEDATARFQVYALDGHELLPVTRGFATRDEARDYANGLWARY